MNIDPETLRFSIGLLISAGAFVYTWIATRDKDNSQHIDAVEKTLGKRIAEHGAQLGVMMKDVDVMKETLKHIPSADEFSELRGQVMALKATQEAVQREVGAVRASLTRIEDFLLSGGHK
ncbi:MAG: hypothetical protein LBQ81_12350 [Zoogloeaceae bacterium]|jgi:hypothetical protein|nr:hypothetical protein [Zoogloeaceae bacterium]